MYHCPLHLKFSRAHLCFFYLLRYGDIARNHSFAMMFCSPPPNTRFRVSPPLLATDTVALCFEISTHFLCSRVPKNPLILSGYQFAQSGVVLMSNGDIDSCDVMITPKGCKFLMSNLPIVSLSPLPFGLKGVQKNNTTYFKFNIGCLIFFLFTEIFFIFVRVLVSRNLCFRKTIY